MKKTLLVILATLLLFTTACSGDGGTPVYPTDNTYHPETDDPYFNTHYKHQLDVVTAENGYYFLIENTLMYADADTMEPIQVCSKPNCTHNEETESDKLRKSREICEAYFSEGQLMYSNGQLYILYVQDHFGSPTGGRVYSLARVSADGSKRRDILTLQDTYLTCCCIHRGRFYAVHQEFLEGNATSAQLWSYSLDNYAEEPVLLYQTETRISQLYAYGNRLYIRVDLRDYQDVSGTRYALRIYDLTTGEWSEVALPEGYDLHQCIIYDEKLWCSCPSISTRYDRVVKPEIMAVYELDGSPVTQTGIDSLYYDNADAQYLYKYSTIDSERAPNGSLLTTNITEQSLYFYDSQMNCVDELPLKAFEREDVAMQSFSTYPLRGGKTLVVVGYAGQSKWGNYSYWYFNQDEIGTGNITPVRMFDCQTGDFSYAYRG